MEQPHSAVWKSYNLQPEYVESFGRVQKLYTDQGNFALKRIPAGRGMDFLHSMQRLYQSGYHHFVPVYPARDGRYGILQGDHLYYLMPWIEGSKERDVILKEKQLLREAARLHILSSKEVPVSPKERQEHYERTKDIWERQETQLEQWIALVEKETYMPPFGLLFCLYYHDLSMAYFYAKEKLKEWMEETKEQEKTRTVQVHGKLAPDHFLLDRQGAGYFINLERSRLATPVHDLVPYFAGVLASSPKKADAEVSHWQHYIEHLPLKKEERLLFQSYLAYPGAMFQTLSTYFTNPKKYSEQQWTRKLQKQYWQLKNIEYFVIQIDSQQDVPQ
ncbi:spore coat protein YsxE [Bacillus xiapuensis]|uniref:spore coat protein YsxE n=1 Tax=Bacillus xiapuensis TaxID=2014075 RepID=UPI0012FD3A64|nr:spore coat protein YsxE [Bacillus xiapuensis]